MPRLIFIGLGLSPETMTLQGIEVASRAENVVSEEYTSMLMGGGIAALEEKIGKKITILERQEVEEGDTILEMARTGEVAFLVAGDAMMATTHSDIRNRARAEGIDTRICYGVSIHTAAASALGLMHYKFGRTATLPFPEGDYLPTSPYDTIYENNKRGLHTLVLLDIKRERELYMTIPDALEVLEIMEKKKKQGFVHEGMLVCGAARVGSKDEVTGAGPIHAMKHWNWGNPLHCVVIPGKLHFTEEESLQQIWVV